jgi:hypothetical protein
VRHLALARAGMTPRCSCGRPSPDAATCSVCPRKLGNALVVAASLGPEPTHGHDNCAENHGPEEQLRPARSGSLAGGLRR